MNCRHFNGPLLGHRQEKCRQTEGRYEKEPVTRFEKNFLSIDSVRKLINGYIDEKES